MTSQTPPKPAAPSNQAQGRSTEEEPRYHVDYLVEASRALLNVSGPVAAGALSAEREKDGRQSLFTVKEAVAAVKAYRKAEITLEGHVAADAAEEENE